MQLLHLFLLAVIQGLTEFLPVSSSGHLILLPQLTGLQDQGLMLDVAVHIGTLAAVMLFFQRETRLAIAGLGDLLRGRRDTPGARLALLLLIATIPVVAAGFAVKTSGLSDQMRDIRVIGWTMLVFGLVLYWADQKGGDAKSDGDWSIRDAIVFGIWQALALVPGTSRSGATISGARALGYGRESAARLAMLMSIPTIIASGTLLGIDAVSEADSTMMLDSALVAAMSFVTALLSLSFMMRLLKSVSFTPYVIYRVILGLALLWIAYS